MPSIFLRIPHIIILIMISTGFYAKAQDIDAKAYILLEPQTGAVMLEHNAHAKLPPASLTKVMTAYVVFDAIKKGEIALTTTTKVSDLARRQGGSRTYLELNDVVTIDTLLRGLLAQSGNDSAVALAEAVSGNLPKFIERMNNSAKKLKMNDTYWMNPNGLPQEGHVTSAHDLGILAKKIIVNYSQYYDYFGLKYFKYADINQKNRNRLLFRDESHVDGMKTGWTVKAGYCVITSKEINGMRLVAVVLGARTPESRFQNSEAAFSYGFDTFKIVKGISQDEISVQASVKTALTNQIVLKPKQDMPSFLVKKTDTASITFKADIPLIEVHQKLPVNTQLGVMRVFFNGDLINTLPLFTTGELIPISKISRLSYVLSSDLK